MQERREAGKEGCMKRGIQERREAGRRESVLEEYRKGGIWDCKDPVPCTLETQERKGYRKFWIQD